MLNTGTIHIAAAILTRSDGATLLVRKRGTLAFMQAGGKIDAGEQPVRALCRELGEELNLTVLPSEMHYVGRFTAPAANEVEQRVVAEVFHLCTEIDVAPSAEIEEVRWVTPAQANDLELAPLTRDHLLPLVEIFAAPPL